MKRKSEEKHQISDMDITAMLSPYSDITILYKTRGPYTYIPSSKMMYYIIHNMNHLPCDNPSFIRRVCPDFLPYILFLLLRRNLLDTIFRVQHIDLLNYKWHGFLSLFMSTFPTKSLPIPEPLLVLFKTLCVSQSELPYFGVVSPTLPNIVGPSPCIMFTKPNIYANMLPNIPAIFALLEHLNGLINANPHVYPSKWQHID
ncbi:hypothetical protein Dsin_019430 [Dipteronia sinensis]|uniref:Uncharacterized protein n=1 Tax=Dipteronia sinensis TaxID=43782 RepID=A0AAE0A821_9ROSI|nr:hypothetical protein Dsin_019430 [Dipteronia sinensis]